MFKKIAIVIAVVIAAVLVYAAFQPDSFRVERSAGIKATPEKIHPLIDDLHSMQTWSAWEKVDPGMKRAHSGGASGVGAVYEWEGNDEIGQGRMEITESSPSTGHPPDGFHQALRRAEHRRIHAEARGRRDAGDAGDLRTHALYVEAIRNLLQHGQDDRREIRGKPGGAEGRC